MSELTVLCTCGHEAIEHTTMGIGVCRMPMCQCSEFTFAPDPAAQGEQERDEKPPVAVLGWLEKWCPCIVNCGADEWWGYGGPSYCDSWDDCYELALDHNAAQQPVREPDTLLNALQRIADHCDPSHPDYSKDHYGIAKIAQDAIDAAKQKTEAGGQP